MLSYAIQVIFMETEQLNVRISKDLRQDLDVVSNLLKISKSEWIKTKLAEYIREEKNKLLMELSTLYSNGVVSKKEIEKLVGKEIADEMEFVKNKTKESVKKGIRYGTELKRRRIRF